MQQIVLENVVKNYTVGEQTISAVNNVSLKINRGEFISIVGHSGSGKTTLLSMIGGIVQPTSGRIMFGGTDIYSLDSDGLSEYRSQKNRLHVPVREPSADPDAQKRTCSCRDFSDRATDQLMLKRPKNILRSSV